LVEAQVETEIEVECVRCLDSAFQPAKLEVEEVIGFVGCSRSGVTYRLTDEGWFDLDPLLREQAWVALPMKPLCRPDCRGICLECGANLNLEPCHCQEVHVDSHLVALGELIKKGE